MRIDAVPRWTVCQAVASGVAHRGMAVEGRFTTPSASEYRRIGYVAGSDAIARILPDEVGRWTYEVWIREESEGEFRRVRAGEFQCVTSEDGGNVFQKHGPVGVGLGTTHLSHADGTPFFYLADTAWSGALLASDGDWRGYLEDRKAKGFTAIQFIMMAPWAAALADEQGRRAFAVNDLTGECVIEDEFFARMDQRMDAVAEAGLLAVPVLAWAANFGASGQLNPGVSLSTGMLELLIGYQVARYGAYPLMWILAGDGRYDGRRAWKWKQIGRRVFGEGGIARRPVAMHAMGEAWPYASYRNESWLDVVGYQSSHSDDPRTLHWLLEGPPATQWKIDRRPVMNLEPCYEGIRNAYKGNAFEAEDVRRAVYGSLLNGPMAGVTYGAHGVWSWEAEPREPLNHVGTGIARPWFEAIGYAGSGDMQRMAELFSSIDWWRLRPAPELLAAPPGEAEMRLFISVAATEGLEVIVIYMPSKASLTLRPQLLSGHRGEWIDPSGGQPGRIIANVQSEMTPPGDGDWILLLRLP
jgi:hypothetical protein